MGVDKKQCIFRTRFAPSPTGALHVGGARTALFAYVLARANKGQFVLRVEDTDTARSCKQHLNAQLNSLAWLGLHPDEGPRVSNGAAGSSDTGPYGPYEQSKRLALYKDYANKLLQSGKAYYCFLKEVEKTTKPGTVSVSPYRDWPLEKALAKLAHEPASIRFKNSQKKLYQFQDLVRGDIKLSSDTVGDFVLLRSCGMPVYNFSCVIDDHLMKISHVLRSEEHLMNTLRQLMLYETLGWQGPRFLHVSLILGPDKKKLSKRDGAVSVEQYIKMGICKEAMQNYLALLGWSHPGGKEIFSIKEMQQVFSYKNFNAAPAVFDIDKLLYINSQHLKAFALGSKEQQQDLWQRIKQLNPEKGLYKIKPWQKALTLFASRLSTLKEAGELFALLNRPQDLDTKAKEALKPTASIELLKSWLKSLPYKASDQDNDQSLPKYMTEEEFKDILSALKREHKLKGAALFMPIRVAVCGRAEGVDLKCLVQCISTAELYKRAKKALENAKNL